MKAHDERPLAAIDVGTNTALLLVARILDGELHVIEDRCESPRLGQGLARSGRLEDEPVQRTLRALELFSGPLAEDCITPEPTPAPPPRCFCLGVVDSQGEGGVCTPTAACSSGFCYSAAGTCPDGHQIGRDHWNEPAKSRPLPPTVCEERAVGSGAHTVLGGEDTVCIRETGGGGRATRSSEDAP